MTTADTLTIRQAYIAMFAYLAEKYERFGFDQLGGLLGDMSFLEDGSTADPAQWNDWLHAVEKAKQGIVDPNLRLEN